MILAFMDFDGTITHTDTLFKFIRFFKGRFAFNTGFVLLLPLLIAYKIGIIPAWKAKELVLSYFFRGIKEKDMIKAGKIFSEKVLPYLIRREAVMEIEFHKRNGARIVIVTASLSIWIKHWCELNQIELISTEYETENGLIIGKIKGKNCSGLEKVNRIKKICDLSKADRIYAYGDKPSDMEMLNIADIKYYKWKRLS